MLRTIRAPLVYEPPKIKGSRFIAALAPARSREQVEAFLRAERATYPDATHLCYAWRLGRDENAFRFSDAGEPSGTAGRPILREIDGRSLSDLVVAVVRYFGGTKLGTGGLVRAYGGAAAAAFQRAEIIEVPRTEPLRLGFAYPCAGAVKGVLAAFGLEPLEADYGADIWMTLAVPIDEMARLGRALTDATAGRIHLETGRPTPRA